MTFTRTLVLLLFIAASGIAQAQGSAAAYPSRPIQVIVTTAAGALNDVETRLYLQKVSEATNWKFVVDYVLGAGGTLAYARTARATPDGYLLLSATTSFTIAPLAYKNLAYDPIKDFTPVSLMSDTPLVLAVYPELPAKSASEYIALTKSKSGKLNFGTAGAGGITHLAGALFHNMTNTKVTFVHYKGGAPSFVDLMAGRIDAVISSPSSQASLAKAGKVRLVGITSRERVALLPDVQTFAEQGLPDFNSSFWVGFSAPANTPASIVSRLNAEFVKVTKAPDLIEKQKQNGTILVGSTPEQFQKHIASELQRFRKLVKDVDLDIAE